jgi:sn-glycerol 3-phosphate transport system ATP-binding protein
MNLLPGQADGSRFRSAASRCPARGPHRAAGALMLGVRPEHADLHPQRPWPLKVEMLEMLGAERLVYGRLGDCACSRAHRRHAVAAAPGDTVPLHVAPQHLHWFDATSGQRV